MKELVVISGKGGTGKTSVVASLASLAGSAVVADCDVDAPDLHLLLEGDVQRTGPFAAGALAGVGAERCTGCGECVELCRYGAIRMRPGGKNNRILVDPLACEGCGVCETFCPAGAIAMTLRQVGRWYVSQTPTGPMVHARLDVGGENSGKLVTQVRTEARREAEHGDAAWLIVDGPPGIGCPVIASIAGADAVLAVTEPTLSALGDLHRVTELASHFDVPLMVCLNKCDLNSRIADQVRAWAQKNQTPVVAEIPYDPIFSEAQVRRTSVVDLPEGPAAEALRGLWQRIGTETLRHNPKRNRQP